MMLAIGSDHAAFDFKEEIKEYLDSKQISYRDFGCFSKERIDYPIYGKAVGRAVASGEYEGGLLFCGTGVGISLAANKVQGIRAVVCSDCYTAKLSKEHNHTNILALGARVVGIELGKLIIDTWLEAKFQGGRHLRRIEMISKIEGERENEE